MDYHRDETYMEGAVLFIDKPLEWTSFDVVNKIRRALKQTLGIRKIKVGHAGTLDPLATGLVIVCTGKATRQISQFQDMEKEYHANIRLGATTPSFDLETEMDAIYPWEHITRPMAEQALTRFTGKMEQLPPQFSAKSVAGKRAYQLARAGKTVELKKQLIQIHRMEILSFDPPELTVEVVCSKGTYIRSLARDLGTALGSGAHLTALRRTRIGPYDVKEAISLENFSKKLKLL
ncbi:MAG TPA: tRNA pseudouridine(55) synthase TruB [Bacteroides sp.]|nr:tRNA pseudouridine(55) synthase TruB [Bacteroides sp.]